VKETTVDDAAKYVLRQSIASALDYPSVYMGGPSQASVRKAIRIVEHLLAHYNITPKIGEATDDAMLVRTWRLAPWDSLENADKRD
jgi:hypothetical protein